MIATLEDKEFNFISAEDKQFINRFDDEMTNLGYDHGGKIGDGYCRGRYMLIYRRSGVKNDMVYARVYLRENSIALRFFLNGIERHQNYIENSPSHVKTAFTSEFGKCKHCHNEKEGRCRFRKTYSIDGKFIEKCNGYTFEFQDTNTEKLPDYISLFKEFFPLRKHETRL